MPPRALFRELLDVILHALARGIQVPIPLDIASRIMAHRIAMDIGQRGEQHQKEKEQTAHHTSPYDDTPHATRFASQP